MYCFKGLDDNANVVLDLKKKVSKFKIFESFSVKQLSLNVYEFIVIIHEN